MAGRAFDSCVGLTPPRPHSSFNLPDILRGLCMVLCLASGLKKVVIFYHGLTESFADFFDASLVALNFLEWEKKKQNQEYNKL